MKYKVTRAIARREKVAKMIAIDVDGHTGWPSGPAKLRVEALLTGAPFAVHDARFGHAEAEVAAALMIDVLRTNGDTWRPLPRSEVGEYLKAHRPDWMANPFIRPNFADLSARGFATDTEEISFTAEGIRRLSRWTIKPSAVVVKRGQWLLDAIDGQASECQTCFGARYMSTVEEGPAWIGSEPHMRCWSCHGAVHNLAGSLPPIEWSPAFRRKLADAVEPFGPTHDGDDWLDHLYAEHGSRLMDARDAPLVTTLHGDPSVEPDCPLAWLSRVEQAVAAGKRPHPVTWQTERHDTRVVARGEHRE